MIKIPDDLTYKITRRFKGYNDKYRHFQGCHRLKTPFFQEKRNITLHFLGMFLRKSYIFGDLN